MKKRERDDLKTEIKANSLITGQGLHECRRILKYKVECSEGMDVREIKTLLRKLEIAERRFRELQGNINDLIFK